MGKIIGLTGGIASGKSTVSALLKKRGAIIIDADVIARKIVERGKPALEEIARVFGEEYILPTGELDRKKLGKRVFHHREDLYRLNAITHPGIRKEIEGEIGFYQKKEPNRTIIIDAALLIEMNLISMVDEVWLVTVPPFIQKQRLILRDRLGEGEAQERIHSQMPVDEKKKYAHKIIDNSGDLKSLEEQVEGLWKGIHSFRRDGH